MNDTDNALARIREIVAEVLAMNPAGIDDTADFVERYHADSLNLMEITAKVEKEYQVTLPQSELQQAYTVTALCEVVARQTT
ncbi:MULTISPECIES: acyl carrier protein [unclassified Mycobacterium]|uniref:acyl carrier protein n=1 Tax=unclassified Mycobacterium TaxID=2642494 RepID=UPI0007FC14E7|nr:MULTISPECIES: acyl carrier protein [unclassified Mycobacterium]OBI17460.1 polyketide-8 synthase acyl carrier protein [Mycobacterium sp. E2497]